MNELTELFELMCDMHKGDRQMMDFRVNLIIFLYINWLEQLQSGLENCQTEREIKKKKKKGTGDGQDFNMRIFVQLNILNSQQGAPPARHDPFMARKALLSLTF